MEANKKKIVVISLKIILTLLILTIAIICLVIALNNLLPTKVYPGVNPELIFEVIRAWFQHFLFQLL